MWRLENDHLYALVSALLHEQNPHLLTHAPMKSHSRTPSQLDSMCQVIRENTTTFRIVKAGECGGGIADLLILLRRPWAKHGGWGWGIVTALAPFTIVFTRTTGATNLTLAMKTPDDAMSMSKIPYGLPIVMHPREGDYTPTKVLFLFPFAHIAVLTSITHKNCQTKTNQIVLPPLRDLCTHTHTHARTHTRTHAHTFPLFSCAPTVCNAGLQHVGTENFQRYL